MKAAERFGSRPSYMSKEQQGEYLKQLRSRPVGSRPLPSSRSTPGLKSSTQQTNNVVSSEQTSNVSERNSITPHVKDVPRTHSRSPFAGRALAQPPSPPPQQAVLSADLIPRSRPTSGVYVERGTRWMEKQETKSLRLALEDMDLKDEQKIFMAAQDEAADLVWKHRNQNEAQKDAFAPYKNDDRPKDYRSHLRRGSYQRSHSSQDLYTQNAKGAELPLEQDADSNESSDRTMPRRAARPSTLLGPVKKLRSTSGAQYEDLAGAVACDIEQARRRSSGGNKRIMSGEKKMFMNPNDRIWEDPSEETTAADAKSSTKSSSLARKNPFARVRLHHDRLERTNSAPDLQVVKPLENDGQTYTPLIPSTNVTEIRSKDIRAATSKSRHDRSPNLPRPTLVSDRPGRPIVSFSAEPTKKEVILGEDKRSTHRSAAQKPAFNPEPMKMPPAYPKSDHSLPAMQTIPVLNFPDQQDVPTIILSTDPDSGSNPTVNIPISTKTHAPSRTAAQGGEVRPIPQHSVSAPVPQSRTHYTPTLRPTGTLCAHCALPIAGRILSAAGQRFHPKCFVCHSCNTNLELVAFYPEPEERRQERLVSCHESDDSLRFYCHLDFHESFSPRCKSCKTPIEGEVVVACGAEWHVGHFFCAQCGDPFDSTTPFVEKDGYAWCVGCHTHRYSSKCRKCRKPVTDVIIKALGSDWHESCFVCVECSGPFDDGRYFLRGQEQDPVCVACEERRLKA